jgi:hypothetical protein
VVPFLPLFRFVPVDPPAKVTWIDIRSEPVNIGQLQSSVEGEMSIPSFKAVKLVGAYEVHLPRKHSFVTLAAEIMGICWDFGMEF